MTIKLYKKNQKRKGLNRSSFLPYWNHDIDIDVESWFPYAVDFSPVTVNRLFSAELGRLASFAMGAESELLYVRSQMGGPMGTLVRENLIRPHVVRPGDFTFAMIFAYSEKMERLLYSITRQFDSVKIGLTLCSIWSGNILLAECKVVALASEDPFFDEGGFCTLLEQKFSEECGEGDTVSYFAEKFGYRRFSIPYETDDLLQLRISQVLFDFEMDEARMIVGPIPAVELSGFPEPME